MSDAIKGFGDRVHASAVYNLGVGGNSGEDGKQVYHGLSLRIGPDLADGNLILAPFASFNMSAVHATRTEEVSGSSVFVPDEERFRGRSRYVGSSTVERSSRTYEVENTAWVDRVSPRAGVAVGWWEPADLQPAYGLGLQAIFEIGPEHLAFHAVEQHYPEKRLKLESSQWETLALKAGLEALIFPPLPLGDAASKGAFGFLFGGYYARTINPLHGKSDNGVEFSMGIATTF